MSAPLYKEVALRSIFVLEIPSTSEFRTNQHRAADDSVVEEVITTSELKEVLAKWQEVSDFVEKICQIQFKSCSCFL